MIDEQTKKWLEYCARTGIHVGDTTEQNQILKNQLAQQNSINERLRNYLQMTSNELAQLQNMFGQQNPTINKPLTTGIHYKKMSLFDAPKSSILCHACNAQGVWGSGIAKEFKSKFPKSFKEYNEYCKTNPTYYTDGTTLVTNTENDQRVGCLITSSNYGDKLNTEQTILINTKHALEDLAKKAGTQTTFYSNKFNSGFFKVPWEHTEKLINDFVKKHNKVWIICDPNLVKDGKK